MLRLFRIHGDSLAPEYQPGDFVWVSKIPFFFHLPQAGDVIFFKHPGYGLLIKMIDRMDTQAKQVWVVGTHPDSIDSREFGAIAMDQVLGKVLWHIHPQR